MPFAPTLFDILLVASTNGLSELLALFSSMTPATLHLASEGPDAVWRLRHTSPDLLILEQGLRVNWPARPDDAQASPPPHVLYLGHESGLAALPGWLAGAATVLPWPGGRPELVQQWVQRHMHWHAEQPAASPLLRAGLLQLDLHRSTAGIGPHQATLTATEASLLAMLMRQAGQIVSREALSQACLDAAPDPKKRRLDTHISNLRRKLLAAAQASPDSPRIHSHRGKGYMLTVGT